MAERDGDFTPQPGESNPSRSRIDSDIGSWGMVPVWHLRACETPSQVAVIAAMSTFCHAASGQDQRQLSRKKIAERAHVHVSTVTDAIKHFEAVGILDVAIATDKDGQHENVYTIHFARPVVSGDPPLVSDEARPTAETEAPPTAEPSAPRARPSKGLTGLSPTGDAASKNRDAAQDDGSPKNRKATPRPKTADLHDSDQVARRRMRNAGGRRTPISPMPPSPPSRDGDRASSTSRPESAFAKKRREDLEYLDRVARGEEE